MASSQPHWITGGSNNEEEEASIPYGVSYARQLSWSTLAGQMIHTHNFALQFVA